VACVSILDGDEKAEWEFDEELRKSLSICAVNASFGRFLRDGEVCWNLENAEVRRAVFIRHCQRSDKLKLSSEI
jgi:hypothetical protein